MADEKTYSEPKCGCYQYGYAAKVVEFVGYTYGSACHEMQICKAAGNAVIEECILAMITIHATAGTVIESGTQEALWETERVLNGLEARLLARARDYYADVMKMSPEEREKWREGVRALRNGAGLN